MKKMIFTLMIIFILLIPVFCYAATIPSGLGPQLPSNQGEAQSLVQGFVGGMMWIGYAIAIGMIAFVGTKYILASADEKASLKGVLVKVAIGSIIIALSVTIANFIASIMSV